jgi:Mg/Co/Ni transporter MgtE
VVGDQLKFDINKDDLVKLHPADIANLLEKLNLKQGGSLLDSLDEVTAAKVLEEVQPEIQKILVQHLGTERAMDIIGKMSTDELVDLMQLLPGYESRKILENLPVSKDVKRVKKILQYDEDEAGGLMSTEYLTVVPEMTVKEAVEKIKKYSHQHRSIFFVYVLDNYGHYLGVVSLRRLIIADPHALVGDLMKRIKGIPGVKPHDEITTIASIMTKYNLLSVAVLDDDHKMLGAVTIDDIMRCLIPNA